MRLRAATRFVAALIVVFGVAVLLTMGRTRLLQAAGWALVAEQPTREADAVVVAIDAGGAGVLEAADLVHAGVSHRVAVFADPPDEVDREFARRGVPLEDTTARLMRQLEALGVSDVERIPRAVAGTEEEAEVLPAWCERHGYRSVLLVTNPDHSRRLQRVLRRAMRGHDIQVAVRYARHSVFDPNDWWQTRGGVRTAVVESEKLLLDALRHPLS